MKGRYYLNNEWVQESLHTKQKVGFKGTHGYIGKFNVILIVGILNQFNFLNMKGD